MGTNYYLHHPEFPPLHIGKSSGGWCFSLRVDPENGISTLDDWIKLWSDSDAYIINEYGDRVTIDYMESEIAQRGNPRGWDDRQWSDMGYHNEANFHELNHSERGQNGLVRSRIGPYCIGHGEGTWDYIVGEFS